MAAGKKVGHTAGMDKKVGEKDWHRRSKIGRICNITVIALEMNGQDIDLVELGLSKIVVEPLLKTLLKIILIGLKILNIVFKSFLKAHIICL